MIIHKHEQYLFIYWRAIQVFSYLCYVMIALYIVGFINNNDAKIYLKNIDNFAKIIVSLFLMWKFNFFRQKVYFSDLDRSIVFHCALFLFLTTTLNEALFYFVLNI